MGAVTRFKIGPGEREEDCLKEAFSRKGIWGLILKVNLREESTHADAKIVGEFCVLDTQLFLLEKKNVLKYLKSFISDLSFSVSFPFHFLFFQF